MRKAIGYLRVGTTRQGDDETVGLVTQRHLIQKFCAEHGLILIDVVHDIGSGSPTSVRPAFDRMIANGLGERPAFEVIVFADHSRFMRDNCKFAFLESALKANGVELFSVTSETAVANRRSFVETIMRSFDEYSRVHRAAQRGAGKRAKGSRP